jgi:hypothetical protein
MAVPIAIGMVDTKFALNFVFTGSSGKFFKICPDGGSDSYRNGRHEVCIKLCIYWLIRKVL